MYDGLCSWQLGLLALIARRRCVPFVWFPPFRWLLFFRSVADVAVAGERKCWKRLYDEVTRTLIGCRSYCNGTAVTAQYVTGTAKRQRQNSNGMVETRHSLALIHRRRAIERYPFGA